MASIDDKKIPVGGKETPIPNRLHDVSEDHVVTGANEVFDDAFGERQSQINDKLRHYTKMAHIRIDAEEITREHNDNLLNEQLKTKQLEVGAVETDSEPIPDSPNMLPSGAVALNLGWYKGNDNPEWVYCITDGAMRVLAGIKKDGSVEWMVGVPTPVKNYVDTHIQELIERLEELEERLTERINEIEEDIVGGLERKVDKEEGKSLINKDYADGVTHVNNSEFVEVKTDKNKKIVEAIMHDGTKMLPAGYNVNGNTVKTTDNSEYLAAWIDNAKHILFAFKRDGDVLFGCGIPSQLKEAIKPFEKLLHYEENPEYVKVLLDKVGHILFGIKNDGSVTWFKGVPEPIKEYISSVIEKNNKALEAIYGYVQENSRFVQVCIDANKKLIWGLNNNGVYEFYANLEFESKSKLLGHINYEDVITKDTNNYPGWAEVVLGDNNEFVAGIRDDGEFTWSKGIPPHLKKAFNYAWSGSHDFNIISVKKDGTGDFTNIQEAINSINDASVVNQYEVQVYDDFYINDLTELWEVHNPTVHSSSEPNVFVSYITTKDFVHLRGMGGKREIYVESPDINMPGSCFKNIHPIFVKGSCKIENFVFKLKGGRYAIHQDMSAYKYGVDSFKTSVYVNIDAIHYGNSMYTNGSGWTGAFAQANGFANGQTQIYINVNWITYDGNNGFYGHTNDQYTLPSRLYFLNCKCLSLGSIKTPSSNSCYLEDRYSCQNNEVYIWGCDFPRFSGRAEGAGAINDNFMGYAAKKRGTKRYCLNTITGSNNKPMVVGIEDGRVLCFVTKNESEKIDVIGGTAKDDIWGLTFKKIEGTGINGIAYGGNYITPGVYSQVHNLSYILGNCRDNPKTLVVRLTDSNNNSTDYTIVFDKNYMTEDGSDYSYNTTPYISQSSIISTINETFGDYFTIGDRMEIIDTFIDCKETVINGGNNAIKRGMAVVRNQEDGFRSWRRANGGEVPDGFAMVDIGIYGYGEVLLKEKNLFHINVLNIQSVSTGNYYKVGNNGFLIQTNDSSEAIMIAIENNVLSNLKK